MPPESPKFAITVGKNKRKRKLTEKPSVHKLQRRQQPVGRNEQRAAAVKKLGVRDDDIAVGKRGNGLGKHLRICLAADDAHRAERRIARHAAQAWAIGMIAHDRALFSREARQQMHSDALAHRGLHAARMQHLRAVQRKAQHVAVVDPVEPHRTGHEPGVGGVYAVNV